MQRKSRNIVKGNDIHFKVQKEIHSKSLVVGINVFYESIDQIKRKSKLFIGLNPQKVADLEDFKIHSFSFLKLLFGSSQGVGIYLGLPHYLKGWIPLSYFFDSIKLFKLFKLKQKSDELKLEFYHFFENQVQTLKQLYLYISHLFRSLSGSN